jgi:hypothetical protein
VNFSKIVSIRTAFLSETCVAPLSLALFAGLIALAVVSTPASAQAVNFGNVNVCPAGKTTPAPCSANQTVSFNIPAGTTIGSIAIVTTGIADLDFKAKADDTNATLCKAKTYGSATTCTVDVTFLPLAAGLRNGAVELLDGTTVVAMTYVYGTGVGSQVAFNPSSPVNLIPGMGNAALTIDAAGNIFATNYNAPKGPEVDEIVAAGGYTTIKKIAAIPDLGSGIGVDGAGNVFVAHFSEDNNLGYVVEILAATDYSTVKTLFSGEYVQIAGLAVDSRGNVFLSDHNSGSPQVSELPAEGGYSALKTLVANDSISGNLAIDSSGNLFVCADDSVIEVFAGGGYTSSKTVPLPFSVFFIAVDVADNLFVNGGTGAVNLSEIVAAGGYTTIVPLLSGDLYTNEALEPSAVDGNGNLFYNSVIYRGESVSYYLSELPRSHPAALNFGKGVVGGSPTTLSTTLQNSGNTTLTGSFSLTNTSDFSFVAGSGTTPVCADGFSLAPSVECNLTVDFTAQSPGPVTGSLVLTDNASNETNPTQAIALSGKGVTAVPQVSATSLQFGSLPYPGSATQPLTITNIGTGTLTIAPSSDGPSTLITGNTCGAGIGAGKSCALQVEFKPARLGSNHDTITIATNGLSSPKVHVSGTATGVGSSISAIDFGTLKGRGKSKTHSIIVMNWGVPGQVTVATETGAVSFQVAGSGCTEGVNPNEYCYIELKYKPTEAGTQTGYIKLIPSTGPVQIIKLTGTLVL